jgi:hypothetical protein
MRSRSAPRTVAPRPKFSGYIGARVGAKPNTGCRRAGAPMQRTLRKCAGSCVTRQPSDGRCPRSVLGIARDDCTDEGVPQPLPKTALS